MVRIGSDHNGFGLKCRPLVHLAERGEEEWDSGCFSPAPVAAGGLRC
jgi:hypothetical protein